MASVAHKPLSHFIICHYILEFLLNQATFTRTTSFCAACKEEGLATLRELFTILFVETFVWIEIRPWGCQNV